MNSVLDSVRRVIPFNYTTSGQGWIRFNCPSCGDKRSRGGFLETATGGFVYCCKNGGCEYQTGIVWEPADGGFFGAARRIYELLGGSLSDIPVEVLFYSGDRILEPTIRKFDPSIENYADWLMADDTAVLLHPPKETVVDFPEIALPGKSVLLFNDRRPSNNNQLMCQSYVLKRGIFFVDYPFIWTPLHPRHVIYPFSYKDKIIGWIGRCIDQVRQPHLKCPNFPTDYMLNQDLAYKRPICFVQEGAFDAIALQSLCTFGNTISKKQINFLNQVKWRGRRVVVLPDFQNNEWEPYWQAARDNDWEISVPLYPYSSGGPKDHIKDAGDSIRRNGLVLTAETIVEGITKNYHAARASLLVRSRGT